MQIMWLIILLNEGPTNEIASTESELHVGFIFLSLFSRSHTLATLTLRRWTDIQISMDGRCLVHLHVEDVVHLQVY